MPMEVIVLPHDPAWVEMFQTESRRVRTALGENALAVHHIGSTAIPSIVAKPVIDMLVAVTDIEAVDTRSDAMVAIGYEAMGELGIPGRRYFRKDNTAGKRTHHVHVFAQGTDQIDRHLAFRDFMNAHSAWAARYGELKQTLVSKHPDSIEAYMAGKDDFIKHVDGLAASWRSRTAKNCD